MGEEGDWLAELTEIGEAILFLDHFSPVLTEKRWARFLGDWLIDLSDWREGKYTLPLYLLWPVIMEIKKKSARERWSTVSLEPHVHTHGLPKTIIISLGSVDPNFPIPHVAGKSVYAKISGHYPLQPTQANTNRHSFIHVSHRPPHLWSLSVWFMARYSPWLPYFVTLPVFSPFRIIFFSTFVVFEKTDASALEGKLG